LPDPILNPEFWSKRLDEARHTELHHALFKCPRDRWERIEAKHREILKEKIGDGESVLDAGCAWGRLLTLLPPGWRGRYLGIDLSPEFVTMARLNNPGRAFVCGEMGDVLASLAEAGERFDWAVLVSMRSMIRRNLGGEAWDEIERRLERICRRLLFLEYDEADPGSEI
jgi:cyclopropane fatty-acyl-phospholipid synthase-like methyltransferase